MHYREWLTMGLVLALCFSGNPAAHADEIDVSGSWQANTRAPGSNEPANTTFLEISENVTTGELMVEINALSAIGCGTLFLAGATRKIATCAATPPLVIGQVSGTDLQIPVIGFFASDLTFEAPFPFPGVGCADPPLARSVSENSIDGVISVDGSGTAIRVSGFASVGSFTFFDNTGSVCFSALAGAPVTLVMLRNDVAVGSNETVEPLDGATVTFETVTGAGSASVTELTEPDGEVPANFQLLDTPIFFDVATTATVSGIVTVCLPYPDADPDDGFVDDTSPPINENDLKILHNDGGLFVDRTVSRDTVNNQICAEVLSLSQFLLGAGSAAHTVTIDIKPGSSPNSINLSSSGVVPVAILSSSLIPAADIDPDSVTLAGARVKIVGKSNKFLCHEEDVNDDGVVDLVCKVETVQFLIEVGDSLAVLEARTFDGIEIRGEDSVRIVPD